MKGKTLKALLSLLVVTSIIAASGCSLIEDTNERPNRDDTTSQSGGTTPGSGGDGAAFIGDNDVAKVNSDNNDEKTLLYVTGIEKNIALRDSDSDNGKVLAQLSLKDEVELIDDSSGTCYYVRYIKENKNGYITKEYLTKEKDAACKRENAYIAKQTPIYNSKEDDKSEIEKLNKNDEIYIVSKNSGDYWFVYSKKDKVFGFVKSMDISSSMPFIGKDKVAEYIRLYGADRLLFGSDYPMWHPVKEYDMFIAAISRMTARFLPGRTGITVVGIFMPIISVYSDSRPKRSYILPCTHCSSSITRSIFSVSFTAPIPKMRFTSTIPMPRSST